VALKKVTNTNQLVEKLVSNYGVDDKIVN